jgi:nucleoside-diphosphate-sugar epimerase
MIRTPENAARLARLDVEIVRGDLLRFETLERAVAGCDAVVHGAAGSKAATGFGTLLLARAAADAGVQRFVHLSTAAVWGFSPGVEVLDESVPLPPCRHPYVRSKGEAEAHVRAASERGLPAVILRPTNVWGPWSASFTAGPVAALKAGSVALVGGGAGPANALYVDNLVHAILRALEEDRAVAGTFVVSDPGTPTWRGLYEAYAAIGGWDVRTATLDEYRALRRPGRVLRAAAAHPRVRAAGSRVLAVIPGGRERVRQRVAGREGGAPPLPSAELAALQTSGHTFKLDHARAVLGYEPPVPFEQALRLTEAWLRFARLV